MTGARPTLAFALAGVLACGGGRAAAVTEAWPEEDEIAPRPFGLRGQPIMELPSFGTYAWVNASRMFSQISPEEDLWSVAPETEEMRDHLSAAIRAHGWRLAVPDSAEYLFAAVELIRASDALVVRDDARDVISQQWRCARLPQAERPACQQTPSRRRVRDRAVVWRPYVGFAIVRTKDRATRWWVVEGWERNEIVRSTLELLLAADRE